MTIPIGEGKYIEIVPREIVKIPVRGYRKLTGIWNRETCNGKGWYRLFNYFKYKPTLCYFKKAGHDENGNTRYEISLFNSIINVTRYFNLWRMKPGKYVRLATEEEKKSFAERIANTENLKKAGIIKQYLSEYEYLLTKEKKCDFKPFDQVLVRASNLGNWNLHLFARVREEEYKYECLGGLKYKECIPYQGNEHLLGTNKNG